MRRLAFYIILTADGMYASPDGGLDYWDPPEDEHRYANALVGRSADTVMGRKMYEVMSYWDELDVDDPATADVEREFAQAWRGSTKHVVSHGQPTLRANATLVQGDVVEAVRALKAGDGPDIGLGCGADLFATLTEAGLIDDVRL